MKAFLVLFGVLLAAGLAPAAPVSLLVLTDSSAIDAQYQQELTDAGYSVTVVSYSNRLTADYLKQFGVVVLSRLPYAGEQYGVIGNTYAYITENLALVHDYVAAGGGLVVEPAMSEFGEAYTDTYNAFLKRYGIGYITQQLRDDAEAKGAYAAGEIAGKSPLTKGLKTVLYPINVMRWDHAYSCTPVIVSDKAWTVLAQGKKTAGTHQAINNGVVGERLTPNRALFAVRPFGKGFIAVSAIHSYYTLTHAFSKEKNLGENDTGVIDGIVLHGEPGGRPSDFGMLLDRVYRSFAANSAKNGLAQAAVPMPEQPKAPPHDPVIDWNTIAVPPTWAHKVQRVYHGDVAYYDELPDPAVVGEMRYFKALVGARTAYSSGSGTVAEYKAAAQAAGYSAIFFTETLADITKDEWAQFLKDCEANSDDTFACLPGFDLTDFQGGRYLVLGAKRYPDPSWLTPDGKRLQAVRMLSLGWFGHVTSVHRAGKGTLHPKMVKHFQGITVYTYDTKGKLADDSLYVYRWQIASDSNPIPIAAHEVTSPADVATAAKTGFQQMLPAPTLAKAVNYFRFALPHFFDCPLRYFISEGPILDGWSIRNKDIGKAEEGRDHYRLGLGVTGDDPITDVTLYDGLGIAGRWTPNGKQFRALVDGQHEMQHEFMLLAKDAKGRRVLSPGIRTVGVNWRLRCGDRQNWLGSMMIYTGWHSGPVRVSMPMRNGVTDGFVAPILDFPFFSNHLRVEEMDMTSSYIDAEWELVGGDAKATYAVRPTDFIDTRATLTAFNPKAGDFAALRIDVAMRLKRDIEPLITGAVYPTIAECTGKNDLLILPNQEPVKISAQKAPVALPVGSYVGGLVILTPGLRLSGRQIGFPAPSADTLTLPEGTEYTAAYLLLKGGPFHWRNMGADPDVDAKAPAALALFGFRGATPYTLALTRGTLEGIAHTATLTAKDGAIAGTLTAGGAQPDYLPLIIRGLNPRCPAALWRADAPRLDYFGIYNGAGMVSLNVDKTVDIFAGNIASCDPTLFVQVVAWNAQTASFRLNNPTNRDITTTFTTAPIPGYKAVNKPVTVKAGQMVEVKE